MKKYHLVFVKSNQSITDENADFSERYISSESDEQINIHAINIESDENLKCVVICEK